jgi:hypothetical protein
MDILDIFILYDVSEAKSATVIRCKLGEGSYSVGPRYKNRVSITGLFLAVPIRYDAFTFYT